MPFAARSGSRSDAHHPVLTGGLVLVLGALRTLIQAIRVGGGGRIYSTPAPATVRG